VEPRAQRYRRERLGEALREEIETMVEGELGDPRIGLVHVTAIVLADDGRSARIAVQVDGDDREAERSLQGLTAAVGYLRHEVAERLQLRRAPELYFHLDRSLQAQGRVEELLLRSQRKRKRKH